MLTDELADHLHICFGECPQPRRYRSFPRSGKEGRLSPHLCLKADLPLPTHNRSRAAHMLAPQSGVAALPRFWKNPAVRLATP